MLTDNDRGIVVDQMEARMRLIEEKCKEFQGIQIKRYSHLKEYVSRLERNVEEENIHKESCLEEKTRLKDELEAKVFAYLDITAKVLSCNKKTR